MTDWERGGLPNDEWEALLLKPGCELIPLDTIVTQCRKTLGGQDGSNLGMAIIREHLATKGLGLHNDLQNEHSIVGNNVGVMLLMANYGTEEQKEEWLPLMLQGNVALHLVLRSRLMGPTRLIWKPKRSGMVMAGKSTALRLGIPIHKAQYDMVMARTSGEPGDGDGITAFLTPMNAEGVKIEEFLGPSICRRIMELYLSVMFM